MTAFGLVALVWFVAVFVAIAAVLVAGRER